MIWIILIIIFIVFIALTSGNSQVTNTSPSQKSFEAEIDVPNPENSNPKSVIEFIDHYDTNVIQPVCEKLLLMDKKIPPLLDSAFRDKIKNHYIIKELYLWNMSIESRKIIADDLESYPHKYIFELKGLQEDKYAKRLISNIIYDEVWIYEQPNNKFDSDAIKVENLEGTIGYVPRDETFDVKKILKNEFKAYINRIERQGTYLYGEIIIYYKDEIRCTKSPNFAPAT